MQRRLSTFPKNPQQIVAELREELGIEQLAVNSLRSVFSLLGTWWTGEEERMKCLFSFLPWLCRVGRPETCGENVSIANSQASGRRCRILFYSHYTAGCSLSGLVVFCIEFAQTRISVQANLVCKTCRWRLCWEKLQLYLQRGTAPTFHPTMLEEPERYEPREANEVQLWKMQVQSSADIQAQNTNILRDVWSSRNLK